MLALTYDMTRRVRVSEAHFAAVRALLSPKQVVELVGVVATYNMVSRFLVALDVGIEDRSQGNAGPPQVSLTLQGDGLGAAQPGGRSESDAAH